MKVFNLINRHNNNTYSSNAYYIRGEWNTLEDVNTLIDVGRDPILFTELEKLNTGVGKTRVEKVLLTHGHYDHCSNLSKIFDLWHPQVYALSRSIANVTDIVREDMNIRIGDREAVVIICPGHSSDSVCFYIPDEKVLFSGDNQLVNIGPGNYQSDFIKSLEKISMLDIRTIYPGHGEPIVKDCNKKIRESLRLLIGENMLNRQNGL